jgi:cysteine desulfurase
MSSPQSSAPPALIYLDHAATTPVDERVKAAMLPFLESEFGNPSSLHHWGRQARKALEAARQSVANSLGAQPQEMVFTSGATEADNLAVIGVAQALQDKGKHIITTGIEHAAVDSACQLLEAQGWDVTRLTVDNEGFVSPEALAEAIRPDTVLASIIHGNNEIGTIQPIEALGALLKERNVLFHIDAVQTVGKLPLNMAALSVDYLSLSAHKIYGPKGVGALYIREGAPLPLPLIIGGGQESNLRSGTENLAGIVGLAKALEIAVEMLSQETLRLRALQAQLIEDVLQAVPQAVLNGPRDVNLRVPGNVHFSFPPVEGEALVLRLDLKGIAVSSGSACHSAVIEPSRIVKALGKPDEVARSTVRFSLGRSTTAEDLQRVVTILPDILQKLGKSKVQ